MVGDGGGGAIRVLADFDEPNDNDEDDESEETFCVEADHFSAIVSGTSWVPAKPAVVKNKLYLLRVKQSRCITWQSFSGRFRLVKRQSRLSRDRWAGDQSQSQTPRHSSPSKSASSSL